MHCFVDRCHYLPVERCLCYSSRNLNFPRSKWTKCAQSMIQTKSHMSRTFHFLILSSSITNWYSHRYISWNKIAQLIYQLMDHRSSSEMNWYKQFLKCNTCDYSKMPTFSWIVKDAGKYLREKSVRETFVYFLNCPRLSSMAIIIRFAVDRHVSGVDGVGAKSDSNFQFTSDKRLLD